MGVVKREPRIETTVGVGREHRVGTTVGMGRERQGTFTILPPHGGGREGREAWVNPTTTTPPVVISHFMFRSAVRNSAAASALHFLIADQLGELKPGSSSSSSPLPSSTSAHLYSFPSAPFFSSDLNIGSKCASSSFLPVATSHLLLPFHASALSPLILPSDQAESYRAPRTIIFVIIIVVILLFSPRRHRKYPFSRYCVVPNSNHQSPPFRLVLLFSPLDFPTSVLSIRWKFHVGRQEERNSGRRANPRRDETTNDERSEIQPQTTSSRRRHRIQMDPISDIKIVSQCRRKIPFTTSAATTTAKEEVEEEVEEEAVTPDRNPSKPHQNSLRGIRMTNGQPTKSPTQARQRRIGGYLASLLIVLMSPLIQPATASLSR